MSGSETGQERLEDMLEEVEEILAHMQEDISLDEAFADYEAGIKKIKRCNAKIEEIEKKIQILNEQGEPEDF